MHRRLSLPVVAQAQTSEADGSQELLFRQMVLV